MVTVHPLLSVDIPVLKLNTKIHENVMNILMLLNIQNVAIQVVNNLCDALMLLDRMVKLFGT